MKTLGHYEVLETLGSGGMGVVYSARDTKLGRLVALKVLPERLTRDGKHVQRIQREARLLASLQHPNIAAIYSFEDRLSSTPFLVLERVEGQSLAERLRAGPLPVLEALDIARSTAVALEAAHARGIVHCDLKPANLMLSTSGMVKVLDFGIARWAPSPSSEDPDSQETVEVPLTWAGQAVGTPAYMSPEQIRGEHPDTRADVFAFGCVLFEMLTGATAFRGRSPGEVVAAVLHRQPDWSELAGHATPDLHALVRGCLAKEPGERSLAMSEIRAEIERLITDVAQAATAVSPAAPAAPEVSTPHNLPVQLTSFVGRRADIEECGRQLPRTRLLTLAGVGGSGKSRLMLRVAERGLDDYPDGVWFVDLAPLAEPARVVSAVASVLGVRESAGETLQGAVLAHLRGRTALLLLDNCEHLLEGVAPLVESVLRGSRYVRVLATSREPLRIQGEQVHPVAPLPLPDPHAGSHPDDAGRSEAVRLFMERARLVRPQLTLDESNAPAIVEICRQLDGIPLALELAAARLKALSVQDVRARLGDRFKLLTGGARSTLSRHQTLRATIQWSYDQLAPAEQLLLRGLSVFAGGWTLDSAAAVCGSAEASTDVLDHLDGLAQKSLVLVESSAGKETRCRFLETVRQYALEKLRELDEEGSTRSRHMRCMLDLVERAEPELIGQDQEIWFERLESEHENILAALAWCDRAEDGAAVGLRMTGALWRFWWYGAHFSLGLARFREALGRDQDGQPTPDRAQALYGAAQMARELGQYEEARDLFEQSLRVAEALQDPARVARAYNGLGNTAEYAGDYAAAAEYHRKALAISREIGNERGVAIDLHNLGIVLMIQGDHAGARPLYEEALALFRRVGDVNGAQATVTNLAMVATRTRAFPAAIEHFREAFRLAEELPSQILTADSLESFAELAVAVGATDLAARIMGTAEAVREATGYALSVENRTQVAELLATIRKSLGEDRHAALEAEGRGMSFDAAVRLVRDWLEAPSRLAGPQAE